MYSGSVYGQRCGQIRVPNDWYVVLFLGGRSAQKSLHRKRRNTYGAEKKHSERYMWSSSPKEMITMWSEKSAAPENCIVLFPQVLYCNLQSQLCQVLFSINSALKIWYAVSKEKARRDHFHHVGAKPLVHPWWIWSHFTFRSINTHIRIQKLICSKQRTGGYGSNHR